MNKKRSIYTNNDDNLFIKRSRKDNYDENNKYYDIDDYKYDDSDDTMTDEITSQLSNIYINANTEVCDTNDFNNFFTDELEEELTLISDEFKIVEQKISNAKLKMESNGD